MVTSKVECTDELIKFVEHVFKGEDVIIDDYDRSRIYINRNDSDTFTIRMWNVTNKHVEWTLFKNILNEDGSGHGEEIKNGVYKFNKEN